MERNKILIEVGAFDGSDSLKYYNNGFKVFTFEPKQDLYDALVKKTAHLSDYTVINKAVSLVNGTIEFNICKEGGASSILPFKDDATLNTYWTKDRQDIHYSGVTYKVQSTRLDTFIEENSLTNTQIDYLHVDAQGADLDVLKSAGSYIKNIRAGVIESAYSSEKTIYVGQENTVATASNWLRENGFAVKKIIPNDHTYCECNIEFVRI